MGQQLPYGYVILAGVSEFGPVFRDGCVVVDEPTFCDTVQYRAGNPFSGGEGHRYRGSVPTGVAGRPPGPDVEYRFSFEVDRQRSAAVGRAFEEAEELGSQLTEPWVDQHDARSGQGSTPVGSVPTRGA